MEFPYADEVLDRFLAVWGLVRFRGRDGIKSIRIGRGWILWRFEISVNDSAPFMFELRSLPAKFAARLLYGLDHFPRLLGT